MDGGLAVEAWEDGAAFRIKAHAGARRRRLAGVHDGAVKVEIETAPERGKANRALLDYLAKTLGVPAADVTLLSGDHRPLKRIGVRGLAPAALRERLYAAGLPRG